MNTTTYPTDFYNQVAKLHSFIRRTASIFANRFNRVLLLALLFCLPANLLKADSITVTITVDNGYGFGFGDQNGIYAGQYYGGVDNCQSYQIFGSPCYVFSPPDDPT